MMVVLSLVVSHLVFGAFLISAPGYGRSAGDEADSCVHRRRLEGNGRQGGRALHLRKVRKDDPQAARARIIWA